MSFRRFHIEFDVVTEYGGESTIYEALKEFFSIYDIVDGYNLRVVEDEPVDINNLTIKHILRRMEDNE